MTCPFPFCTDAFITMPSDYCNSALAFHREDLCFLFMPMVVLNFDFLWWKAPKMFATLDIIVTQWKKKSELTLKRRGEIIRLLFLLFWWEHVKKPLFWPSHLESVVAGTLFTPLSLRWSGRVEQINMSAHVGLLGNKWAIRKTWAMCGPHQTRSRGFFTAGPCGTFKWLGSLQEWSTNNGLIILFFNQNVKSEHDNIIIYFSSGGANIRL